MAKESKKEIIDALHSIGNSILVIGAGEGLVDEVNIVIERIKSEL